jgi:hypothetical protein
MVWFSTARRALQAVHWLRRIRVSLAASIRSDQPRQILEPALSPLAVDWDLGFRREPTQKALAYWDFLCAGRKMPRRPELSPHSMREFLPHVNLVDLVLERADAPVDYIVSLQGQHAHQIFGPVAHRRLNEVLPPHIEQRWRLIFGLASRAARPVRWSSRMLAGGKSWLEGEVLVAPLGDECLGVESLFLVFATWFAQDEAARARVVVAQDRVPLPS